MIYHANNKRRKAGVAVLKSDKTHIKTKSITKDQEGTSKNTKVNSSG